jgi:hypothetical protein
VVHIRFPFRNSNGLNDYLAGGFYSGMDLEQLPWMAMPEIKTTNLWARSAKEVGMNALKVNHIIRKGNRESG